MKPQELYSKSVEIGKLSLEEEEIISQDACYSYYYALITLKSRFPKGEKAISKNLSFSLGYARDVLKSRFLLGEKSISQDKRYTKLYCEHFKISEKDLMPSKKDIINSFYKK